MQGDPRLALGPDGSSLTFNGGQPIMDRGLENLAFISLFTSPGWCGNAVLSVPIGSDFEQACNQPITRTALNRIRSAAERALSNPLFGRVVATVENPTGQNLRVTIRIERGGLTLTLTRSNSAWHFQASDPAHAKKKLPTRGVAVWDDAQIWDDNQVWEDFPL
jgi:hypothetical protein